MDIATVLESTPWGFVLFGLAILVVLYFAWDTDQYPATATDEVTKPAPLDALPSVQEVA